MGSIYTFTNLKIVNQAKLYPLNVGTVFFFYFRTSFQLQRQLLHTCNSKLAALLFGVGQNAASEGCGRRGMSQLRPLITFN